MSTTSTVNGWTLPALGDPANIETAVATPLAQVDLRVVPIFATVAARTTALAAPTAGQMCYVTATGEWYAYTGTVWAGARPRHKFKTSNQTVTDSVTLTNDADIFFTVEANSRYVLTMGLTYVSATGTTTNDLKQDWSVPAACTIQYGFAGGVDDGGVLDNACHFAGTPAPLGVAASNRYVLISGLVTTVGTAGTIQWQFAENTAIGGVTSVSAQAQTWAQLLKIA